MAASGWDRWDWVWVRSSVAGAWVRSSGWSEIELGGACSRRRSYAVVADGKYPGLVEERGNQYREKREGTGKWERRKEKMKKREGTREWERRKERKWRERREKRKYKIIKFLQHLSVPLQICNGTVHMWYNFCHLEHLIKLCFCVWCAKCAKNLAFGTFSTSAVGALST